MFGHDDKKDEDRHEDAQAADNNPAFNPVSNNDDSSWQHPGPPPADDGDNQADQSGPTEDFTAGHTDDSDQSDQAQAPASVDAPDLNPEHALPASDDADTSFGSPATASDFGGTADNSNHDLIDLKQEALGKLSPLIGHLDQSPEEKFRTLMMMIQASDDQSLIRQAYDTASQIDDEKTRAQALLDIVNEINYFTQNPQNSKPE
jgi:hypothetical protein